MNFRRFMLPLLLVLGWGTGAAFADSSRHATNCLDIDWNVSEDSDAVALQAGPGLKFASINRNSVVFDTLPETIAHGSVNHDHVIHSVSRGCFRPEHLMIGTNRVDLSWVMTGWVSKGTSLTLFKLQQGNGRERELCRDAGRNGGSCTSSFDLSLEEISPSTAERIRDLKHDMRRLERRLGELREAKPSVDELRARLDALVDQDLEKLTPEALAEVSGEVSDLWSMVEGLQGDLSAMRDQYAAKLETQRAELAGMHDSAMTALIEQGIDVRDENLYGKYIVRPEEIPAIDLAAIEGGTSDFQAGDNLYLDFERTIVDSIDRSVREDDMVGLLVIREAWSKKAGVLVSNLASRSGDASTEEMKVLSDVIQRVNAKFNQLVDDYGFRRRSAAPKELRQGIQDEIAPVEPGRAGALRDAINSWKNEQPTPQQELVLETSQGLVAGYAALKAIPAEESQAILPKLNRIIDSTIEAAKTVARVGVSFTPLNDFVDFCEIVTGREFCVPGAKELTVEERAFSAMGLVVGSRQFWGEVGKCVEASPRLATWAERFKAVTARASEYISRVSDEVRGLIEKVVVKLTGRSRATREFVVRVAASGQGRRAEDLERIAARYADLEKRFKNVPVSPESGSTFKIWRGKKRQYVDEAVDEVSEVFKWDEFSRKANYRYSVGGEFGQEALYGSIGPENRAMQTVIAEMRGTEEDVVIAMKAVRVNKVLDLRDPGTLRSLNLRPDELMLRSGPNGPFAYELTQQVGDLASRHGFDAIIAKSVEGAEIGGENLIILKR